MSGMSSNPAVRLSRNCICLRRYLLILCSMLFSATSKRRLPGLHDDFLGNHTNIPELGTESFDYFKPEDHQGKSSHNLRRSLITSPEDHRVYNLPGLDSSETIVHYAGHISVDSKSRGEFFYWLFDAKVNPETAPLIIWLNGGPGCSSMDGLFLEVGPFHIDDPNGNLKLNPYSWHNVANVLFIDQPVGTGLSFTFSRSGYPTSDGGVNAHFLTFLDGFFNLHKRFTTTIDGKITTRDVYFAGESHAGHYIPSILAAILNRNKEAASSGGRIIKIGGAALGNPWIDPYYQYAASDIAHGLGLITIGQKYALNEMERQCQEHLKQGRYNSRVCFSLIDDIVDSSGLGGNQHVLIYDSRKYSSTAGSFPPGHSLVEAYLNKPDVRLAIHATACPHKYVECANPPYHALAHQDGKGVTKELSEVLDAGIRILVYAGQYDLICNHVGIEKALMQLPWSGNVEWTKAPSGIWAIDGKPAGYTKSFGTLNYLRVMDSGHMVPLDQPSISLNMITKFIQNQGYSGGLAKIAPKLVDPLTANCPVQSSFTSSMKSRKTVRGRISLRD